MRFPWLLTACVALLVGAPLQARDKPPAVAASTQASPAHGVIGIEEQHLTPEFWVARLATPDAVVLDQAAIAAQNANLLRTDPTIHDLRALPATLTRSQVAGWIEALSQRPDDAMYDVEGEQVPDTTLDALVAELAIAAIPETQPTRHGLVVHRADLRTFPTALRVFSRSGETDIDRFQESALFPGTPVVIAHESRDGRWWFVVSPRYAAWIEKQHVAEGSAADVFAYVDKRPYRVVTGATEHTVFTREQPAVSELQLDMGVRVPLADWPADKSVNGQHPYTAHVIELPMRDADGKLQRVPALLPKRADSAADYLPLTQANLIRQAFKFLGERYGWGHAYNAATAAASSPRSTAAWASRSRATPATRRAARRWTTPLFGDGDGKQRMAAVDALQVGDLVYIPGHVMMMIGRVDGAPYVIHDTNGGAYLGADGKLRRMALNGVSVTPLMPMMFNERERYVDRITSIVRIRP